MGVMTMKETMMILRSTKIIQAKMVLVKTRLLKCTRLLRHFNKVQFNSRPVHKKHCKSTHINTYLLVNSIYLW